MYTLEQVENGWLVKQIKNGAWQEFRQFITYDEALQHLHQSGADLSGGNFDDRGLEHIPELRKASQ